MTKKRLISFDHETKISNNFTFEEDVTGNNDHHFVISREQDVTAIINDNKEQLKETDKHTKWGDWNKVASIPMVVYYDLKAKGILDDPVAIKKWLNDPENKYFRTREGNV